jgi:hypothetical protein
LGNRHKGVSPNPRFFPAAVLRSFLARTFRTSLIYRKFWFRDELPCGFRPRHRVVPRRPSKTAIHEMRQLAKRNGGDDPSLDIVLVDAETGASLTESFKFVPDGSQAYDLFTGADIDNLTVETREGLQIVPGTPKIGALTTADLDKTMGAATFQPQKSDAMLYFHVGAIVLAAGE